MKPNNELPLEDVSFQKWQMDTMVTEAIKRKNIPDFIDPDTLFAAVGAYREYIVGYKLSIYQDTLASSNLTVNQFNHWFNDNSFLIARTWLDAWVSNVAYNIEQGE